MTGGAVFGEDFRPGGNVLSGFRMTIERRPYVIGDLLDFLRFQQAIGAEARHRAGAGIRIAAADPMRDGLLDVVQRAAPDPRAGGQRRVAWLATTTGAVARLAV